MEEYVSQPGLELEHSSKGKLIALVMIPHSISVPIAFKQIILFNFCVNSIKKGLLSLICYQGYLWLTGLSPRVQG